jgi:hypothetical protein
MIEIYEGEVNVTFVVSDAYVIQGIKGFQTLYNNLGEPTPVETNLFYTSTPLGGVPAEKMLTVDVAELSQWPAGFRIEISLLDGSTPRVIKTNYDVVQPYVSVQNIALAGGFNTSDVDAPGYRNPVVIRDMESVARHVINAYTGRTFGRFYDSRVIEGSDTDRLYSDEHFSWIGAVSVENGDVLYDEDSNNEVEISPSGHLLYVKDGASRYGFPEGYKYRIVGIFGETSIPYDIQLAAKMLTVHYLCEDAAQQNQYIDQIKFGESQTRANRLAFAGTGLMTVDRILEPYRVGTFRVL